MRSVVAKVAVVLTVFLGLAASGGVALARDYSAMYSASELKRVSEVYGANIEAVLYDDLRPHLTQDELALLARVRLYQPWERTEDPFEFAADSAQGIILIPAFSVKFLDDLAIATAWFERFNCDKQAIFDYLAALDFSTQPLDAPLKALGVPDKAYLLDEYVDDVWQKLLKSALGFILLHELGHVHFRHKGYGQLSAEQAQRQEAQSDAFALAILRRVHLPPMGMALWFSAVAVRDPLSAGSPRQTHPLSAQRLRAIAEALRDRPEDFIEAGNRDRWDANTINDISKQFDVIADTLADAQARQLLRQRGEALDPSKLAHSCPGAN
ncbi:phage exclusion protein Lit family protein [Aliagarivorans taiwanensis]|uniref:phage exclusion protein Lit family protein n=1 Tax=Aliagarivorans taiwanensis TaxID=561966 RepID=UPI000419037C|nr:phage exclusion protein Lit family protein [Aliagarivorans taiwanensis]